MINPKRALLSTTDKSGLVEFAKELAARGFELVSTGGTAKALRDASIAVTDVSEVTGFPEMMEGRLKTLHPLIHGGLLGDVRLEHHVADMKSAAIQPFQVVCVNLYQFEKTVSGEHRLEEAIESIDIGGPAMIRAASKNYPNLYVVVDPADYGRVIEALDAEDSDLKLSLAAKAFRHTAYYDSVISAYLTWTAGEDLLDSETLALGWRRSKAFRYAENPHQRGALYRSPLYKGGIAQAEQIWGIELGYNNWNDGDGALELVSDMPAISCAITKHGNPCGAASAASLAEAFNLARQADPISAFGGVVALNGVLDLAAAEAMTAKGNKLDVIIAAGFEDAALEVFKTRKGWGQEVRLLVAAPSRNESYLGLKTVRGGALAQETDEDPLGEWRVVTEKAPTDDEWEALQFLWRIIPHVKSNAIIVGRGLSLLGVGAGQMNRVQSVRLALEQAGQQAKGCCLASDAFFPFPDSIETAAAAGVASLVQPGGSKKDGEVIAKANELGLSMCFTGVRHFRH
jgi:phosphoribosylaminoimidazolecarboxamide formyltransferase/IMP cyclohydrolase